MVISEASWTGSERERRPQGVCLPPVVKANKTPKYQIKPGTLVSVTKVSPVYWRKHTTTITLGFERYEHYEDAYYEFRHQGWLIQVHWMQVVHREF